MFKAYRFLQKYYLILFLFLFISESICAENTPKILFLPLVSKGGVTELECEKTTTEFAEEFQKLSLCELTVSTNLLAELKLTEYDSGNSNLRKRISDLGNFDYILSGFLFKKENTKQYIVYFSLDNFLSKENKVYYQSIYGEVVEELIQAHLNALKKSKIFITDKKSIREKYLNIFKRYSPDTYPIIDYITKNNSLDILDFILAIESTSDGFITAIHEGTHNYTRKTKNSNELSFYINTEETILVKITETFPSKELGSVIPENLRTSYFTIYITGEPTPSPTQKEGIYGLMDEFDAYYQGTLVACDLFPYYKQNIFNNDFAPYFDFLSGIYSDRCEYYEFKYFIYTYLLYAKKEKPKIYKEIISNTEFIKVFLKIDDLYGKLVERIFRAEKELDEYLNGREMYLKIDKEFTYIYKKDGDVAGRSNYLEKFLLLKEELNKDKYRELEYEIFNK